MYRTLMHPSRRHLVLAAAVFLAACADRTPLEPAPDSAIAQHLALSAAAEESKAIAEIRRATARYHDLDAAIADGFVLLHPCEERPGEGPVGIVYVHFGRVLDGVIDPQAPDALVYEPSTNGRPKLVGAEFAILFSMWTDPAPPQFLGAEFQPEDEFGVWGLHVWAWRHNPEGMFAESNPNVSCTAES
jgi:hypothetical protein